MLTDPSRTVRITVTVPGDIAEAAEAFAASEGLSVSAFYAGAVEGRVRELRRRRAAERITRALRSSDAAEAAIEAIACERRGGERDLT